MSILVTGVAGFIGAQVAAALRRDGRDVVGLDNLTPYYDVGLKKARLEWLADSTGNALGEFRFLEQDVSDAAAIGELARRFDLEAVVHLAAQPGVRYSLENPQAYIDANVTGHLSILELCRTAARAPHLVYASSSSVYGDNEKMPFSETDRVDKPASVYAATKRSAELLSESYSRLYGLRQIGLRFFTVYGPWGRPDMAPWLFTEAIFAGRPIRVFNRGEMQRDFTYIDDIVAGVVAATVRPPEGPPHQIYNLGNNRPVALLDFIAALERAIGRPAEKDFVEMQRGDVKATYADIDKAAAALGFAPSTGLDDGLAAFVDWFAAYHKIDRSQAAVTSKG